VAVTPSGEGVSSLGVGGKAGSGVGVLRSAVVVLSGEFVGWVGLSWLAVGVVVVTNRNWVQPENASIHTSPRAIRVIGVR
jgi:hypothetical protein